jgi:hypothetical protein
MNFEKISKEIFQILRSFDHEVHLFDDDGNKVFEPEDARRFYALPENLFVSVIDEGQNSAVRCYLGKSTEIGSVEGMIQALRAATTKYNVTFHVRKYDREITPKDFATRAAVTERKEMNILEGMYGTSRSSYLKLENARMIVRHSAKVNEENVGARGRNVDSIYIENAVGERHLFPAKSIVPARAMTHHVDRGGSWSDETGNRLSTLGQDYSNLVEAVRHIGGSGSLSEGVKSMRGCIREKVIEMRRVFEGMCKRTRHDEAVARIAEMTKEPLNEVEARARLQEVTTMLGESARGLREAVLESVAKFVEDMLVAKKDAEKNDREIKPKNVDKKPERDFDALADTDAVKDFESWTEGFSPERVFEYDRFQQPEDPNHEDEAAVDRIVSDFDYNAFMRSGSAEEFMHDVRDEMTPEEMTFTVDEVARSIQNYLENEIEAMDIYGYDMATEAKNLLSTVLPYLKDDGYIIDGEEPVVEDAPGDEDLSDEDDVLSKEDILVPTNQSRDLRDEVTKKIVKDPGSGKDITPDASYASRLQSLAGIGRNTR